MPTLLRMNIDYWRTVAPVVAHELAHWQTHARAIPEPSLRELALSKLRDERFNAEAAAMLATLAPARHRSEVVRAIVALQVLFDLLDGLSEGPSAEPLSDGERLFAAFTTALEPSADAPPDGDDPHDGYPRELAGAAGASLARLPAAAAVRDVARDAAGRAAQAQIRMHGVPRLGAEQLREWAEEQSRETGLPWRETLAGAASSVLALHALVALAADPSATDAEARRLDACYLSICVLVTLLDGVIDAREDALSGQTAYVDLFETRELLVASIADAARRARLAAAALPDASAHLVVLNGVAGYYLSAPGAQPILTAELKASLGGLLAPTLATMRIWRTLRAVRERHMPPRRSSTRRAA